MDELSKFVNKSFNGSKVEIKFQCLTNKIYNSEFKQNLTSISENSAYNNNNDNESIDVDITDLSSSDDSKSSADISVANFQKMSVISEKKALDKRIFCVNMNKTYMENFTSEVICGYKNKNWLLTDSFKENKPMDCSKELGIVNK